MSIAPLTSSKATSRIIALDYLRGFFIVVIIVDHLWRWPNILAYISGRGELWASAAEGFVIISGLLVGYVRGYKNRQQPLSVVSKKLVARGLMLYIWSVITTLLIVTALWTLSFKGAISYVPIGQFNWHDLIVRSISLQYVHTLTYFLYLYAIFLVISPVMIWLLRRRQAWFGALLSLAGWGIGVQLQVEWLQWQILFFLPVVAGFYLEPALTAYKKWPAKRRRVVRFGTLGAMLITVIISASVVLPFTPGDYDSPFFGRNPITFPTVILSFVWFIGLLSLFQYALPFLQRYFGWLLLTFGERSLTAYILQVVPLMVAQIFFVQYTNILVNTLIAIGCILATWALMKIPRVNKVIPR